MQHYKKLLLGMVATLSLFATATPVFASTGGTLAKHRDFNTGVSSSATVEKSTSQATQAVTRSTQASSLSLGWNVINGDGNKIMFKGDDGNILKGGWKKSLDTWTYFTDEGYMKRSAWLEDSGKWYYVDESGKMIADQNVDGYYLDKSGAWSGSARAGKATVGKTRVNTDSSCSGFTSISTAEFESKVLNGEIKAKVEYYQNTGGSTTGKSYGSVMFYLAN